MVKRKIYDIVPPEKRKNVFSSNKIDISKAKTKAKDFSEKPIKESLAVTKKKNLLRNIIIISSFVLFIFGFGFWFFSSAREVIVELKPKTNPLVLNTTIAFTTSTQSLDLSKIGNSEVSIPTQAISTEKEFRDNFTSSLVSVEEKAKGTIRVYNKHNRLISLVQGTRFLSSTKPAKLFRSLKKISIPAGGYIDVPVEASESGDSYNIEACAFSIPGLRNFSPPQLYFDVFGKSLSKMEGGRIEKIHKITDKNLEEAKKQLLERAVNDSQKILQEKAGPDFIIVDKSIQTEASIGGLVNASVGQEAPSFVYQLKVKINGIKIQKSILLNFAKSYISLNIPLPMKVVEDKIKIKFISENSEELTSDIEIQAETYHEIDQKSLKEIIKSRNLNSISRYVLEVAPNLEGAPKIIFKPFWARKATSDIDKIIIKIKF